VRLTQPPASEPSLSSTIARVLAGSWRADLGSGLVRSGAPLAVADLERAARALLASGAGGLAWWRVHDTPALADSAAGQRFAEAFRLQRLGAAVHESELLKVLPALEDAAIDYVLIKGWEAARLYPERGMRPYGDIDICVLRADRPRARAALAHIPEGAQVDLTHDIEVADDEEFRRLASSARLVSLGKVEVRVPSPEDHLRVMALHLLKHGAWRPLWLCDVAAAVEGRGASFDWARCLGSDPREADQVLATVALAHVVLGADVRGTPAQERASRMPHWFPRALWRAWCSPWPIAHGPEPVALPSVRHPLAVLRRLGSRWPDPITASIQMGMPFDDRPRLGAQLRYQVRRTGRYLRTQSER